MAIIWSFEEWRVVLDKTRVQVDVATLHSTSNWPTGRENKEASLAPCLDALRPFVKRCTGMKKLLQVSTALSDDICSYLEASMLYSIRTCKKKMRCQNVLGNWIQMGLYNIKNAIESAL